MLPATLTIAPSSPSTAPSFGAGAQAQTRRPNINFPFNALDQRAYDGGFSLF
ncbi:hypothetical protein ACSS6W_006136 [Trichoderma asperelloides]